ncbi:MAG: class I SAM-dependent methyltransferase [Elainella sp.]
MPPDLPLHAQNPQGRFSDRASDYASYRPSYPPAAIDTILANLGDPAQLRVADIGAGTGISSRLLAERSAAVWAIEPNAAMRAAAQPHPDLSFQDGTAEQTGLPDQSVDLVTCFQSFHWFEPSTSLREFHRILRPAGRVALIWNDRDREDEFTNQYTDAILQAVDPVYFERIDRKASDAEALRLSPLFQDYQAHQFPNRHPLSRAGLVGLALSASYVPKSGELHDQLIQNLQQLYDSWQGAEMAYRTHVFVARRGSEGVRG